MLTYALLKTNNALQVCMSFWTLQYVVNIDGATTVKELLDTHPGVFDILLAHGICESCQTAPPPVPLHHFATKHCGGNLNGLIAELEDKIQSKTP